MRGGGGGGGGEGGGEERGGRGMGGRGEERHLPPFLNPLVVVIMFVQQNVSNYRAIKNKQLKTILKLMTLRLR